MKKISKPVTNLQRKPTLDFRIKYTWKEVFMERKQPGIPLLAKQHFIASY